LVAPPGNRKIHPGHWELDRTKLIRHGRNVFRAYDKQGRQAQRPMQAGMGVTWLAYSP